MKHQLIAVFAAVLFLAGCNDPEITSEPVTTATQDTPYTYALSAKDDDDANERFEWEMTEGPEWLTLNVGQRTPVNISDERIFAQAVAWHKNGDIYAVTATNLIKITPEGTTTIIATVACSGSCLGLLIIDNILFISDYNESQIRKLDLNNVAAGFSTFVNIEGPVAMVVKDDHIFVASYGANKIQKIEISNPTNNQTVVEAIGPYGVGFSSSGDMYVSQILFSRIIRYKLKDGEFNLDDDFNNVGYISIDMPTDVKIDKQDNIYVSSYPITFYFGSEEEEGNVSVFKARSMEKVIISNGGTWGMALSPGGRLAWGNLSTRYVQTLDTEKVELTGTPTNEDVNENITEANRPKVKIKVTDTDGDTDTQEFTLTVNNVNDAPTGTVTIEGVAEQDETLTAINNDIADEDGPEELEISFQWFRDGSPIPDANEESYLLTADDVGTEIYVKALYTDAYETQEELVSAAVNPIYVNNAPTGNVTISGTPTQGEALSASQMIEDLDGLGDLTYQWYSNGNLINGATNATYILSQNDVGTSISVVVSYTDNGGTNESISSTASPAVENVNDAPTGAITISGTAAQFETLTSDSTLADADGLGALNYQWQANGVAITGATGDSLALSAAEIGQAISLVVSYIDELGTSETVSSTSTAAVANVNEQPTGSVVIVGSAEEYANLTINNTVDDPDGLDNIADNGGFEYQWRADGAPISGATVNNYTLTAEEIGKTITVTLAYTDDYATAEMLTSSATPEVININDEPAGSVSISGTALEGETLTASNNLSDVDGPETLVISYQWLADNSAISGATDSTLVLSDDEVDKEITVVASYTDFYNTNESVSSDPTAQVLALTADFSNINLADVNDGNGGFVIQGLGFPDGKIGDAVASGDVNGDGISDLILGAHFDSFFDGIVYVIFGKAEGLNANIDLTDVGVSVDGFKITAAGSGANLGFSLSFIGDMNGDGMGDMIIGAPGIVDGSFNPVGGSYVVFGKNTNTSLDVANINADSAGFAIPAAPGDMSNGSSVSAAGDVNSDSIPDVIIGAPGSNNGNGAAYVVFGKASSTTVDLSQLSTSDEGFAMTGGSLDNAGYAVSTAGDLNNDGNADLIVSAPEDSMSATTQGVTYVVLGKADSNPIVLSNLLAGGANDAEGFAIFGEKNDDFSGDWVRSAGDVNGDNIDDLLITAVFFSPDGGTTRTGRSYIVFGVQSMTADIQLSDVVSGTGGFVINADLGEAIALGLPASPIGDIDGDELDDLMVGAPATGQFANSEGAAYVIFGKSDNTNDVKISDLDAETGGFKISGITNDLAGRALASAGDINGDGKTDFMLGAPGNFKVYVIYGR